MRFVRIAVVGLLACGGNATTGTPPPTEDASTPPQTFPVLGEAISIGDVAVFQAVKATIVKAGAAVDVPNAPVIADRPGMLRVYMTPIAGWTSRPLSAELHLSFAGKDIAVLTDAKTLVEPMTEKDLASTFNFTIAADQIPADVEYRIVVRDPAVPADRSEGTVQFPADGVPILLGAGAFSELKVTVVPVQYDADGSGRLPDTSQTQLDSYRDTIYKWYPTSKVQVSVRSAPLPWNQVVDGDGTGWSALLSAIGDVRAQDAPPDDVYYIGTFRSMDTVQSYCSGGCILGLAPLASANDVGSRVALAIGYAGSGRSTVAHELGHAHGRNHAPCGGAGGPDAKFPYAGGRIGVFGWDVLTKKLLDPNLYRDFMGYCNPDWVSDYTYKNLYARVRYVNKAAMSVAAPGDFDDFQMMYVMSDGSVRPGSRTKAKPASADDPTVTLSYLGANGAVLGHERVRFIPYDHLPGGILMLPASKSGVRARIDELSWVRPFALATSSGNRPPL